MFIITIASTLQIVVTVILFLVAVHRVGWFAQAFSNVVWWVETLLDIYPDEWQPIHIRTLSYTVVFVTTLLLMVMNGLMLGISSNVHWFIAAIPTTSVVLVNLFVTFIFHIVFHNNSNRTVFTHSSGFAYLLTGSLVLIVSIFNPVLYTFEPIYSFLYLPNMLAIALLSITACGLYEIVIYIRNRLTHKE